MGRHRQRHRCLGDRFLGTSSPRISRLILLRRRLGRTFRLLGAHRSVRRVQRWRVLDGGHSTVHPLPLDRTFTLALKSKVEEERGGSVEVVDDDTNMIEMILDAHPSY